MSDYTVITLEPHEKVIWAIVLPPRLNSSTAAQLEDEVSRAILDIPTLPLVLDLSNVKFAPSVALGVLVNLFKGMKIANRKACAIGVNRQLRGALNVTRLDAIIEVHPSMEAALARL